MPVQTYKNFITEQYHKNPAFYSISAGSIEKVLAHIDVILSAAMEDWNKTTNHAAPALPPMIFFLSQRDRTAIQRNLLSFSRWIMMEIQWSIRQFHCPIWKTNEEVYL